MTAEEHRGLGLLIALASSGCLGLPRYSEDDGGGDEGDDTTQANDEGPSPEGPEGPSPEGPEGPSPTTSVDDAESFLFMPDVGPITSPTTGEPSDVTTEPPPPPEACAAYSALIGECYDRDAAAYAFMYCVQYLEYIEGYTPECVPAFEDFLVCISEISCQELSSGSFCEVELQKFGECQGGG